MDDRVRIYELARQMNLTNQDVITGFRELGYDIKSHSSTVDRQAVGLFIAHVNKKKQPKEQPKSSNSSNNINNNNNNINNRPTGASGKTATKGVPTPPAPVVKPRVLARYKPTPPPVPGETPVVPEHDPAAPPDRPGMLPAAASSKPHMTQVPTVTPPAPVLPPEPVAPVQPIVEAEKITEAPVQEIISPEPPEAKVETPPIQEPPVEVVPEAVKVAEPEKAPGLPGTTKEDKVVEPKKEVEDKEDRGAKKLQAMRPMTPSIPTPTRIAAPSLRATPPRPPKHRPSGGQRHGEKREEKSKPVAATIEIPKEIALTSAITVKELAEKMQVGENEVIKRLMMKGFMRTINQVVELELSRELALEMGYELQTLADLKLEEEAIEEEKKAVKRQAEENLTDDEKAALVTRPPVVTIMGHVDHGKTSLLDAIRQTKFLLTDSEAGGITQHIGAYHVEVSGEDGQLRQVVFLDTPGHEAFTAMRARGAKCTDIAILVVAADDGVMPQTIEAIDHAKAAGVPIIVAVNKVDKAGADPDRVLNQLMEHGILPDRFGGETVTCNVSAKKRTGLDELLEMILLVADMQDLKANPDKVASGVIVEAELHRGKGAVATALVQNGTLRVGDIIVAGGVFGRVRALHDDRGQAVRAAGPSMPVEVLGLPEVPRAGDTFEVFEDLQLAKQMAEQRKEAEVEKRQHRVTLESLHDLVEQGEVRDLNIIVKADVLGTAEAIGDQMRKLSTKEVQVRLLRFATGDISENDVNLATSSNAIVIGFNVQPDNNAKSAAEGAGVDIRTYNIIYEIIDDLERAIQGLLQPIKEEVQLGTAEVRQVFKFGKNQMIAGCYIITGKVQRGSIARIVRDGTQIYEGKIDTLKRFKDDAKEVATGFECGISCDKFSDIQIGDLINSFIITEKKREK